MSRRTKLQSVPQVARQMTNAFSTSDVFPQVVIIFHSHRFTAPCSLLIIRLLSISTLQQTRHHAMSQAKTDQQRQRHEDNDQQNVS